jgi:hypothetical protein
LSGILKSINPKIALLFLFIGTYFLPIFGQCDRVLIQGQVVDSLFPQGFYNLMVINKTNGRGVFGQPDGHFSVVASPNDIIALSTKYYPIYQFVAYPDYNCQCKILAYIERIPQEFTEVIIRPLKSLQQIKEERAALALRETKLVSGINVLESPITAIYQAFSKKEQNKKWIAAQEYKDDQRKVVKELLRLYVSFDIINLSEDEFDDFISFMNLDTDFLKTATEMELILFIKDKYDHFQRFKLQDE